MITYQDFIEDIQFDGGGVPNGILPLFVSVISHVDKDNLIPMKSKIEYVTNLMAHLARHKQKVYFLHEQSFLTENIQSTWRISHDKYRKMVPSYTENYFHAGSYETIQHIVTHIDHRPEFKETFFFVFESSQKNEFYEKMIREYKPWTDTHKIIFTGIK